MTEQALDDLELQIISEYKNLDRLNYILYTTVSYIDGNNNVVEEYIDMSFQKLFAKCVLDSLYSKRVVFQIKLSNSNLFIVIDYI